MTKIWSDETLGRLDRTVLIAGPNWQMLTNYVKALAGDRHIVHWKSTANAEINGQDYLLVMLGDRTAEDRLRGLGVVQDLVIVDPQYRLSIDLLRRLATIRCLEDEPTATAWKALP